MVTEPVKDPGGRRVGSTVTPMVVGADPFVELSESQFKPVAVVIVTDAVYAKDARLVKTFRGIVVVV